MVIKKLSYQTGDDGDWAEPIPIGMDAKYVTIEPLTIPDPESSGAKKTFTNLYDILQGFAKLFNFSATTQIEENS